MVIKMDKIKLKNWFIKKLNGYTSDEYDSIASNIKMQNSLLRLAKDHNHYFANLDDLKKFWDERTNKEIIKYSAALTRKHPTRDEWMFPKYARPMHEYLLYDDKFTEGKYQELAQHYLDKIETQVGMDIDSLSADDIIFLIQQNLIVDFNPAGKYMTDNSNHGVTDVWESPQYLFETLEQNEGANDCDGYMLFFHNILAECMAIVYPNELWRLNCCIIELPTHVRHAINIWFKGDDVRYGVGVIPLETTMSPDYFRYDWNNNIFLTKGRYKIIHGFNNLNEWKWI